LHFRRGAFILPARGKTSVGTDGNWTVLSLLDWGDRYLRERGLDESRLHTELLLAHVLGLTRLELYLQFDRPLTGEDLAAFKVLFKRRLAREPLQYILGRTEFMGFPIAVDRRVLIPRPETELLVEAAVQVLKERGGEGEVLEVGTGSGNIAVALGRFLPGAAILSIDVSSEALAVAAQNIGANGVTNVTLKQGDIRRESFGPDRFDLIISNPPYVAREELEEPEVRDHEPLIATTDGGDGLSFFPLLFDIAGASLRKGGWLLMEIGHGQGEAVLRLARERGFPGGEVRPDYAGIPRVFRARHSA
jgi:release factor glutamine methyltransferase